MSQQNEEDGPLAYIARPNEAGIRSRRVDNGNGLEMHYLECSPRTLEEASGPRGMSRGDDYPTVLLLHGFPEIAYSWRKVMPTLAEAGYRVIAPDQRGYGRTTGWDDRYHGDLRSYHFLNLVRDAMGLLAALDVPSVSAVVGHDFGASVAAYCALIRPDVFRSMVLMSAPFSGPPEISADSEAPASGVRAIEADLASLPRPRKHYHAYYATEAANEEMQHCPEGVHDFLRAYFHHKSADWTQNAPFALEAWTAHELAQLPTYYVMDLAESMPETVAHEMPTAEVIEAQVWLTERELEVYSAEYASTGFQGGLNWYRSRLDGGFNRELQIFSGVKVVVPACFISGRQDWGVRQSPGALEKMQREACADMSECHLIEGAGHWVQQEQPAAVIEHLSSFLRQVGN